jgi:hypothetical protein
LLKKYKTKKTSREPLEVFYLVTLEGFPVCRQAGNPQPSEPKSDIPCLPAGRYPVAYLPARTNDHKQKNLKKVLEAF